MAEPKVPAVYIMVSGLRGTVYIGVTSNLVQRNYQHKHGLIPGFSKRYRCTLLVWYEIHETMESAILREKQPRLAHVRRKLNSSKKEIHSGMIYQHPFSPSQRHCEACFASATGVVRTRPKQSICCTDTLRGQDGLLRYALAMTLLERAVS